LGSAPSGYQVQVTTQASILGQIVDLFAQPFTSPTSAPQQNYYPQPMYEYQTQAATQKPQPIYTQAYQQPTPQKTIRPTYYTHPTYQPTRQPSRTTSNLPAIDSHIASQSERLSELEYQCGMPISRQQNAVSLVVNGNAAYKGQVR
jgi:hypothetical protein